MGTSYPNLYRPTWAEIDLFYLRNNVTVIKNKVGDQVRLIAVVKADAYGHGAVPIARELILTGVVDWLGVSSIEEGVLLRRAGLIVPILILGSIYPYSTLPDIYTFKLTPTVASLEMVDHLDQIAQQFQYRLPVHLKIDTGMGRVGVTPENANLLIERIYQSNLVLEGIYTHFAMADGDPEFTDFQFQSFIRVVNPWQNRICIHVANSAALLRNEEFKLNCIRPGLLLYGLLPFSGAEQLIEVKPVLSLRTHIVYLKSVPPGRKISYAGTYTTTRNSLIATLPIGYADGISRFLSNQGEVLVRGKRVKIIGRVTMDMIMVDVTDIPGVNVGDEAVLIGSQGSECITVEEIAAKIGTINYELVCQLSHRVPRIYKNSLNS